MWGSRDPYKDGAFLIGLIGVVVLVLAGLLVFGSNDGSGLPPNATAVGEDCYTYTYYMPVGKVWVPMTSTRCDTIYVTPTP